MPISNGLVIDRSSSGGLRSGAGATRSLACPLDITSFRAMAMPIELVAAKPARTTARHRNDRLVIDDLWNVARHAKSTREREAARAALGGRFVMAAFIALIPLFGFALGVPPKRSTSALGLGCGILLIVGFVQLIVAIEDGAHPLAPLFQLLTLLAFMFAALAMLHVQRVRGPGAIEAMLASAGRPFVHLSRWAPLDRVLMRLPAEHRVMRAAHR